jgi:hypothetical protein
MNCFTAIEGVTWVIAGEAVMISQMDELRISPIPFEKLRDEQVR